MKGIVFNDATFMYDGYEHSINVEGAPKNSVITYSPSNSHTDIGKYVITAKITHKKYKPLTIHRQTLPKNSNVPNKNFAK